MMGSKWFILFCIALPLMSLSAAHILGNESDRLALLTLKDQMSLYPTERMSSWNDSNHFCYWEGLKCSHRRQRVVMLDLSSQGLTGSIPPSIGNLSFLRYVNLKNNSLHGRIHQEIGYLFRLQVLYVNNNSLSGTIPVSLSNCSNLDSLDMGHNKLTGKIPEEFGSFSKLQDVDLSANQLTGGILVSFGNLTSLQFFRLRDTGMTGGIPDSLGQLKRLKLIGLSENNLSGMVPPVLYNISSLEGISLGQNQLEGSLPNDIGSNLPLLRNLYIAVNKFTGPIPVSLFLNCTSLNALMFGNNNFVGNVPTEIGSSKVLTRLVVTQNNLGSGGKVQDLDFITSLNNCSDLQILSIATNQFGGRLPASFTNLSTKLNLLYLGENQITGNIPSQIENFVNLVGFSVNYNFLNGTIPASIGRIQKLQRLELAGNQFSGQIPNSIGNITSLYSLDLSDNTLEGSIVVSFEKSPNLQYLHLDSNHLTGIVPKQIFTLSTQLLFINLSSNYLTGSLPLEVGSLNNLGILDISENKIGGQIPSTLGGCTFLDRLYFQGNFFHGPMPASFSSLKGIQMIDLSRNNLSGKILKGIVDLPYLIYLNLSFNNFDGEVPISGVCRNASKFSISGNSKLCGGITELHLPKCNTKRPKDNNRLPLVVKLTLDLLLPSLIIGSLLLFFYWKNKSSAKISSNHLLKNSLRRVSYNELRDATNGFSTENLIGVGSFGSVYKGCLQNDERLVGVKVLNLTVKGASKSFMAECEILRKVRHRNSLKILTVCSSIDFQGNDFKALVFQFMPNGNLENWLHQSSDRSQRPSHFLNLLQRLSIAIDVASALDYLHNYSPAPIIHCDLKPSNVLLDDEMVACVGDFGLAKLLSKSTSNLDKSQTSSITVRGTIGYIPPEYGMGGEVTAQGDVYSYGIMLLEMFTGKRPTDEMFTDGLSLHGFCKSNITDQLMEITDMRLLLEETTDGSTIEDVEGQRGKRISTKECLISIIEVGVACSLEPPSERMNINDILAKMHKIKRIFVSMGNHVEM